MNTNIKKINKKIYIMTIGIYFLMIICLIWFFNYFFKIDDMFSANFKENSIFLVIEIIIRNFMNFLQYIILSPVMPILYILDCITTAWAITVSISINGLFETLAKLIPHGIIEIPNFCLYTYISYKMMKSFYYNISDKNYKLIREILTYKGILKINLLLIIIAGIIEGLIT